MRECKRLVHHQERISPASLHRRKSYLDIGEGTDGPELEGRAQGSAGRFQLPPVYRVGGIRPVPKNSHTGYPRGRLLEQLQGLGNVIRGERREPRHIAPGRARLATSPSPTGSAV